MNYRTLVAMGYIFNPDGFDWMNIKLMPDNEYTYHHIIERRNGGDDSIENGAILTEVSHRFLNILEQFCSKAYDDLQNVFKKISSSMAPPTNEIVQEIDQILYDIFYTDKYHLDENKLPTKSWHRYLEARGAYDASRKKLQKCL